GGAVLVYILALPLLVPVMIFGLEASQASDLGRSALPALGVLLGLAGFGLLLGPWIARKLISLILE
ncbi:MAG: heme exporter protein CcmB, partial [Limnobacter sp.]|nr:heme exporter protein CcmB [Limnobacter sp.]